MKNNRLALLSLISALFIGFSLSAQTNKPNMGFEKTEHDFGTIKESDGKVHYSFKFTNLGSQPVIINNVKASCGCTTPDWSKEPILPGAEGFIEVSYNPANRPGPFRKSIRVTSNALNSPVTLYIKGEVSSKMQSKPQAYRYNIGDLRVKSNHISLGKLPKGKTGNTSVDVMNSGNAPLTLDFTNVPDHITLDAKPKTLKPKESGIIQVTYNSNKIDDWDFNIDRIKIRLNNQEPAKNNISISAVLIENFSDMSDEELANAPKVHYPEKTFNFGTISQKESVDYNFVVKNNGKSDLIIRKVKASCGCTAVKPAKSILSPGESTNIKTTFNPSGRNGSVRKSITVITNDPKNYKSLLWVRGTVEGRSQKTEEPK